MNASTEFSPSLWASKMLMITGMLMLCGGMIAKSDVALAGFVILACGAWLGWKRLECPQCHKRMNAVAVEMKHCHHCGANYSEKKQAT